MDPNEIQQGGNPNMMPQVGMPMASEDDPLVSDEQKQALLSIIEQIQQKIGGLNATQFASGNKTESVRRDLLRQVFGKLQSAGVDLTSKESVANFIGKLQERSPELAQMFEDAMNALLGGEESGATDIASQGLGQNMPQELEQNMNNENNNENIAQNLPQGI